MTYSFLPSNAERINARRTSLWSAALGFIERLFERIEHQRVVRRDLNRLMEFDDRELADIGLSRGDLMHVVRYGRFPKHNARHR